MRISGGKAGGVALKVDSKAVHRPAMDKLRQGVFSSLGQRVENARVCDLFAGTGSYGLEAISRGAKHATFVELNPRAVVMIKTNMEIVSKSMNLPIDAMAFQADALKWEPPMQAFDLVFADPPYDSLNRIIPSLFALFDKLLAPEGIVVFEVPGQCEPSSLGWRLRKRLGKGQHQPTACLLERCTGERESGPFKHPPNPNP